MNSRKQAGFTLTELMVSTGLSLTVIAAVLTGYVATYTNTLGTLASSKLNHEMTSLMSLMSNDIRRAGYWGGLNASTDPTGNPFNVVGDTALTVFDSMAGNSSVGPQGSGTCVVYAYDLASSGNVDADELFGFRLNSGVVQMRTAGTPGNPASCADPDDVWEDLTDINTVNVTALVFDLAGSSCLNTREPDGLDNDGDGVVDNPEEADCYAAPLPAAGSGDITVETRELRITLTGTLADDSFVRVTQSQTVRVRNELVRER